MSKILSIPYTGRLDGDIYYATDYVSRSESLTIPFPPIPGKISSFILSIPLYGDPLMATVSNFNATLQEIPAFVDENTYLGILPGLGIHESGVIPEFIFEVHNGAGDVLGSANFTVLIEAQS